MRFDAQQLGTMFKSHCLVSNRIRHDQLNPPHGLSVTYAIQRQRSPCRSGWSIEATKPTQHQPKAKTPIRLLLLQEEQQTLILTIGIERLAMIGRESTGLSTVRPAIKVR